KIIDSGCKFAFDSRQGPQEARLPASHTFGGNDMRKTLLATAGAVAVLIGGLMPAAAEIVLKASHQLPGGKCDPRDEMVQIIAREVEKANVGLKIQVFPGASLFKPNEQWGALTKGQLDMSAFPLDYASGRHPQFSA